MLTAVIAASSNGDNQIVAAVAGYKYRVIAFLLSFGGTVNAKWKSGTGTDLTGLVYGILATQSQSPKLPRTPAGVLPQFTTNVAEDLTLNLSTNVAVGGYVLYEKIPASM